MKLIYITNTRLPSEKANGIQIAKMCEAFVFNRVNLELVFSEREEEIKDDFFEYYGLKNKFKLTKLKSWDLVGKIPRLGFRIQSLTFAINTFFYLRKYKGVVYSRDQFSSIILSFNKRIKIVFEIHRLPEKIKLYHRFFLKRVYKFVAISKGLRIDLIKLGISENKILIAHDGVDLNKFKVESGKLKVREELNLPLDKKIILYAGHLYEWKGAHILAKAISKLNNDYVAVFVGGTDEDIVKFKKFIKENNLQNILLLGHKKPEKIPYYLKSADVLVLPNSGKERISSHHTSPLKLFEYMASSIPIIASDLPSIREVLNENNALFFEADNAEDLAKKIKFALQNNDFSDKISKQSLKDVTSFTWDKRSKNIIDFIKE